MILPLLEPRTPHLRNLYITLHRLLSLPDNGIKLAAAIATLRVLCSEQDFELTSV